MTIREKLFEFIPERFFVKKLSENSIGHIKLAFVRETINPLIIRSTDSEATIILVSIDGRELVEIPPRKFKSREKLLGLMICREFGVVDESVRYNSIFDSNHLNNPNSLLFGDSVTQSNDAAALPSRAIYDWAYSLRDVKDITDKLQHNAISEDGTILKDKDFNPKQEDGTKVASQALHQTEYVLPGTYFPHFITVDNITPELFIHLLSCVLNQRRYGAQTTTTANNVNNHLVAIGFSSFEKPINSYTISKTWDQENRAQKKDGSSIEPPTLDSVQQFVQKQMQIHYGDSGLLSSTSTKKIGSLLELFNQLWDEFDSTRNSKNETGNTESQDKETLAQIYNGAQKNVDEYLREIKMVTEKQTRKGEAPQKVRRRKHNDKLSLLQRRIKMKILPIRIKLLSPLFNYCKVTNSGAITSDFIGDLALTYALNRAGKHQPFKPFAENFYQVTARAPNYLELRELDYYFTVAKPIRFAMTGIYIRNTLFNVDNFIDQGIIGRDGSARKSLFKNFFRVQGVRPDSEFSTCLLSKDSFPLKLPCTIRLGTGRECLALLEKDREFDEKKDEVWLNAFTLKWVFQNLPFAIARLTKDANLFFEYKLENYIVMKRITLEQVKHIFGDVFND